MFSKINLKNFVFLFLALALAACATSQAPTQNVPSTALATTLPPAQPTLPPTQPTLAATAAPVILDTQAPSLPPTQPSGGAPADITLDYSVVSQDVTVETVAAQPESAGGPYWEVAPQYRRLTLQGYPVANHLLKPQIFIYPVGDLASANENAAKIAADLQTLLQTQQTGDRLPFLPLINASQVMHAQVQYLDFKSGKGVRFLAQFDQAPLPVNNYELIYTFQGLTGDGKYYIAAVLPLTNPELPAGPQVGEQQAKALNDFPGYLSGIVTLLNRQPAGSFTPGLDKLDALIRSIEVK
jgi:hypothetical protein